MKHFYLQCVIGKPGPPKTYAGQVNGYNLPTPTGDTGGTLTIVNFENQKFFNGFVTSVEPSGVGVEKLTASGLIGGVKPATATCLLTLDGKNLSIVVDDPTFDPDNSLSNDAVTYGYAYP